ncbi:putative aldose 1-epimerase [Escherichia coli]|nr:putative aldose 1-epimerase [Escherichia coli]
MTIYTLSHGSLKLDISDQGGVIEGFWRDTTPLLRPGKKSGVATDASCFPLVPFANRVSGNRFVWQGREYQLQPNVEWGCALSTRRWLAGRVAMCLAQR